VPPGAVHEALRFLVGGSRRDVQTAIRAEAYERMVDQCGGRYRLWRARRGVSCVAVSLVVASAGRVGMVFHSPPGAPGVQGDCLAPVVAAAAGQGLADNLAFVQSLVVPGRQADVDVLVSAGFGRLAELVYMRLELARWLAEASDSPPCRWRDAHRFDERELAEVIRRTYEESLDCPALCGLRELKDVIDGHKASGVFSPTSWWIAEVQGRPAGCILVNESLVSDGDVEIVYMGVVREFRGQGVGRAMVRRAASWAREAGRAFVNVAVDDRNVYAKNVYEREGFREIDRRLAYLLTPCSAGRRRGSEGDSGPECE